MSNGPLTVLEYDQLERAAISKAPNRIIEAFQPITFNKVGYPSRIHKESELKKYVDVMYETRFELIFSQQLEGLMQNEFELFKTLTDYIYRFTQSSFNEGLIARSSVMKAIHVLRHIRFLYGEKKPRIFEIGPGCGYLGALLMMEGYPYIATENSRAFYLYQNHFWHFLTEGYLLELAQEKDPIKGINESSARAIHIPWWHFALLTPETIPPIDVMTANHVLTEMHPQSRGLTLALARAALKNENSSFLFEGWGCTAFQQQSTVCHDFYCSGFSLAHHDSDIVIFSPIKTDGAINNLVLPQRSRMIKRYVQNFCRRLLRANPLSEESKYQPPPFSSINNSLSGRIILGRASSKDLKTTTIEDVNTFYSQLFGSENYLTKDEQFLLQCGVKPGNY